MDTRTQRAHSKKPYAFVPHQQVKFCWFSIAKPWKKNCHTWDFARSDQLNLTRNWTRKQPDFSLVAPKTEMVGKKHETSLYNMWKYIWMHQRKEQTCLLWLQSCTELWHYSGQLSCRGYRGHMSYMLAKTTPYKNGHQNI